MNLKSVLIELLVTSEIDSIPLKWTMTVASSKYTSNQSLKTAGHWNYHTILPYPIPHCIKSIFTTIFVENIIKKKTCRPRPETITWPGSGLVVKKHTYRSFSSHNNWSYLIFQLKNTMVANVVVAPVGWCSPDQLFQQPLPQYWPTAPSRRGGCSRPLFSFV